LAYRLNATRLPLTQSKVTVHLKTP